MKKITEYINKLSPKEQALFAERCGTTINYLRKAVSTRQTLSAKLSVALEQESKGFITRQYLHPHTYWLMWPEIHHNAGDGLPPGIARKRGKAA
ncbi:MAG: helix-turn-helix domain-containing protein [Firmicutes bacterium]|nr:helix-turn-helix domain-containing protein [Bacillota bacterium]